MNRSSFNRWCEQYARLTAVALLGAAGIVAAPREARAVLAIDSGGDSSAFINATVNATPLYSANTFTPTIGGVGLSEGFGGNFGQDSIVAIVDVGLVDNTNPAITNLTAYFNINVPSNAPVAPPSNLIGTHATAVGTFAAGNNTTTSDPVVSDVGFGIAPLATMWSGSIISGGNANGTPSNTPGPTTFQQTNASVIYPFVQAIQVGVSGKTADVVNASIGAPNEQTGDNFETVAIDGLAAQNAHTTVVIASGDAGPAADSVDSPAAGFNNISVAALASDPTMTYQNVASYSSRGPNDFFNPATGITTPGAIAMRPAVDIAAPGDVIISSATPVVGQSGQYTITGGDGTSFSAPLVSGAVAELTTYAHALQASSLNSLFSQQFSDATDSRVMKAVLLNSATKNGAWNNGQVMSGGVLTTQQGLDDNVGAGFLNVARAADNYLNGNFDPKVVSVGTVATNVGAKGWDLSTVTSSQPNFYNLGQLSAGQTLTATLDWFVGDAYDSTTMDATFQNFVNLNLKVLEVPLVGSPTLIALSDAQFNNVQQLSFELTSTADYELEVQFAGVLYSDPSLATPTSEEYGLAWSNVDVPEPVGLGLVMPALLLCRRRRVKTCKPV